MLQRNLSRIEVIIANSPVATVMGRHKQRATDELYRVLTDCLQIAEICLDDAEEWRVLDCLIKELPTLPGKNRSYVESSSDVYQRVCRFMFHGEEHTANTNRYAHCLREAARRGIDSKKLLWELRNGGVNKFFLKRPGARVNVEVTTKCLHLNKTITHGKNMKFMLQLRREEDGVYTVLGFEGVQ